MAANVIANFFIVFQIVCSKDRNKKFERQNLDLNYYEGSSITMVLFISAFAYAGHAMYLLHELMIIPITTTTNPIV